MVTETYRPLAAAIWMIGAIVSFTSMAIAGRAVSHQLDTFELMTWRSVTGLAIVVTIALVRGTLHQIRRDRLGLHLTRNLFHFTGQNLWFWAITVIPLAQVFALEFTAPLWVVLLSPFLLGERITRIKAISAGMGFVGILIVARPDIGALNPAVLAAAGSAICFAGTAIFTKRLTRHETITSILFWLTLMQVVFGIVASGWDGDVTLPTASTIPWLILIGCAGLLAHFCLTTALTLAPASVVMPIDFARLPVIAVIGVLLYGEPLDTWVFVGAGVIFVANWINIQSQNRASAPQKTV